jgi:hypothetical protein
MGLNLIDIEGRPGGGKYPNLFYFSFSVHFRKKGTKNAIIEFAIGLSWVVAHSPKGGDAL